ncbi:putative membrane protein [Flavobacterium sp. 270]|uniref:TMEM175 family protein n=1 Tax=Flavobacterium sp. 270 TaxID=2512114 RepID=UPI0010647F84|nr:TMEM175 family protein [Flavobacterium sp. 270]TDW49185.1 putative membrane protein [Flavobacterium sp. 270]
MEKETVRIEGFSDAVFAIAITLLVLDLHTPNADIVKNGAQLLAYLKGEWTTYLAFTLSFFSIFIMWVNHHKIFKQIYSRNTAIMFANGLILFLVSAVSFPTALLARFFNGEASNIAVAVYTGIFVFINISYNLLWFIASKNRNLLRPDITDSAIRKIRNNYLYGFPTYLIAFAISFEFPAIALVINMLLLVFWAVSSGKINVVQE